MIIVYANSLLAVLNSRVALGSNSRNVSDSTELSTSFHVARHQDNIFLSRVSMPFFFWFYRVILCRQERFEHGKALAETRRT